MWPEGAGEHGRHTRLNPLAKASSGTIICHCTLNRFWLLQPGGVIKGSIEAFKKGKEREIYDVLEIIFYCSCGISSGLSGSVLDGSRKVTLGS